MRRLDVLRPLLALVLAATTAAALVREPGDVLVPAVLAGLGLRLWCGLPELLSLGAEHRTDLLVEVVGGAAVTLTAVLLARGTDDLPADAALLSAAAVLVLLAPVLRLLRRDPPPR